MSELRDPPAGVDASSWATVIRIAPAFWRSAGRLDRELLARMAAHPDPAAIAAIDDWESLYSTRRRDLALAMVYATDVAAQLTAHLLGIPIPRAMHR